MDPLPPPWGHCGKAAVIHDWLYRQQDRTRLAADRIFLEAMRVLAVPPWRRRILYSAFRAGGWAAWRQYHR